MTANDQPRSIFPVLKLIFSNSITKIATIQMTVSILLIRIFFITRSLGLQYASKVSNPPQNCFTKPDES